MTIRLWDLRTKQCLRVFEGHLGQVQCIQALGNRFVSGSLDNTIRIWDLETGQCLKTLFGHVEGVWCVRFDKLRIVSGAHDKTVKVRVIPLLPSPPLLSISHPLIIVCFVRSRADLGCLHWGMSSHPH